MIRTPGRPTATAVVLTLIVIGLSGAGSVHTTKAALTDAVSATGSFAAGTWDDTEKSCDLTAYDISASPEHLTASYQTEEMDDGHVKFEAEEGDTLGENGNNGIHTFVLEAEHADTPLWNRVKAGKDTYTNELKSGDTTTIHGGAYELALSTSGTDDQRQYTLDISTIGDTDEKDTQAVSVVGVSVCGAFDEQHPSEDTGSEEDTA